MNVFKAEISNILLTSNNWSFKIHVLASSLLRCNHIVYSREKVKKKNMLVP